MAQLYNVFIRQRDGVTREQIEEQLNLAADWFRYSDGCYLVYSSKNISTWYQRLKPFVNPGGNVLILDVDAHEYNGWMPKTLWPWLAAKKQKMYDDT